MLQEASLMDVDLPVLKDPEIQAGTPCFTGTRVPVASLFTALSKGRTLDYFLENFSSVSREQAIAVLAHAERLVKVNARMAK